MFQHLEVSFPELPALHQQRIGHASAYAHPAVPGGKISPGSDEPTRAILVCSMSY